MALIWTDFKLVEGLRKQIAEKAKLIESFIKDRTTLVAKGSEERVARLAALNAATDKVRGYLRAFAQAEQALLSMQDEVNNLRKDNAPEELRKMSERYRASGLRGAQWNDFLLNYVTDVESDIKKSIPRHNAQ